MRLLASDRAGRVTLVVREGPERYWAFHPNPLPPDPPLRVTTELQAQLDAANQALGRLDGVTLLLPDPDLFLYTYIRKEAVLSSQIEGTQSSLSDLLLFEHDATLAVPREDALETSNYITAMNHGLETIRTGRLPLCNRLIREVHGLLLRTGRGSDRAPGEFRRTQNWIGGSSPATARYVPPPSNEVEPLMANLERFLHDDPHPTPILLKAAVAHAQFETIHPFLDGNGRVGRLLVTLLLAADGVLERPLLYLSLFLKQNREAYYEFLQGVRRDGAWEEWITFFLDGVIAVAGAATDTTRKIMAMIDRDRQRIQALDRGAATASRVHDVAARFVLVSPREVAEALGITPPPVYTAISRLEEIGILREVTGRQRGKLYAYDEYLALLNEGTTEPPG
jgi:Fic family protein